MLSPEERKAVNEMAQLAANAKSAASQVITVIDKVSMIMQRLRGPSGMITDTTRVVLRQRAAALKAEMRNIQELVDEIEDL